MLLLSTTHNIDQQLVELLKFSGLLGTSDSVPIDSAWCEDSEINYCASNANQLIACLINLRHMDATFVPDGQVHYASKMLRTRSINPVKVDDKWVLKSYFPSGHYEIPPVYWPYLKS